MQRRKELFDPRVGDPVPERLALAPVRDDALLAHLRQMLRQGRLRETNGCRERGDVRFAPLHELAGDHQPPLVCERAQDVRDLGCGLKIVELGAEPVTVPRYFSDR